MSCWTPRAYKQLDANTDPEVARESSGQLVVVVHRAWGLQEKSSPWPLGGDGVYFKMKLGNRKVKTVGKPGPEPRWESQLVLPYCGEDTARFIITRHYTGRPNNVLACASLALGCLPSHPLQTDLPLLNSANRPLPGGGVSVTVSLELGASAVALPGAGPVLANGSSIPTRSTSSPPRVQSNTLSVSQGGRPLSSRGTDKAESAEDRRAKAIAAAEQRQAAAEQRGIGDATRAKEMQERRQREELIGRIHEKCAAMRIDPPMGLAMASMDQLQNALKNLQGPKREGTAS